jgi:type VI secretion system protein ImpK
VTLHPRDRIALERKVFAPPPPPPPVEPNRITQLQRIRAALAPEIQAGAVSVEPSPNAIVVRVPSVAMFDSGDADVKEGFLSRAARIGAMLEKEWGWIRIVGHSDSTPVNTTRFASNWELSLARARAVSGVLKPSISKPQRIQVDGKGSDSPIASNATADGRARNRRVEILVERTD